ncbi:hypothetical protein [Edaphobacter modestus]|uniref:Uncharacterized protein n=1 Tax=Edaphobacter modestus TaxID=388466 RepID=A0A4Q7YNY9_9BACT|nr:hypothetical protein [Edaphobacter modestus]RZU39140.1 hypothetical protein BDD14_0479 [Edaphobacter modestus]
MPFELSLVDLVSPYVLQGDTFGAWHAVLGILRVAEHEIAADENGITIRGTVEFEGNLTVDPSNMSLAFNNTENHPENDASRRDPWIDVRDARLDFQLVVPRTASQKVSTAVNTIGANAAFANTAKVLIAYDTIPNDAPPSDYPTTEFVLDLLLTSVVLRPPFLRGAKREASGQLVPDPQNDKVKFTLPRLKFRLAQGSSNTDPLNATLLSAGASGLDDPGDIAVAELIKMDPPYAFIGPSQMVGFGFRSGTLDLSDQSTPPDVLSQFGFDESWTGLYLPEIRLFIAPHGARDFAVDAGVENLLIGIGASSGITGDFSLQVLDQGAGPLKMGARFYDGDQRGYGIVKTSDTTATVQLPAQSRIVADVEGGRTPMTVTIKVGADTPVAGREADVDLSINATQTIVIAAVDSSSPVRSATFTITASRRPAPVSLPGTTSLGPTPAAQLTGTSTVQGTSPVQQPRLSIVSETANSVTVGLNVAPGRAALTAWTLNGVAAGTSATLVVDLPAGGPDAGITATLPGESGVTQFESFYRFDKPPYSENNRVLTPPEIAAFALIPDNTHSTKASDEGTTSNWLGGSDVRTALLPVLQGLPDNTAIQIDGFASYEGPPPPAVDLTKRAYNDALASRRAAGVRAIIESLIAEPANNLQAKNFSLSDASNMTNWTNQGFPAVETRRIWWKAVASWPAANTPGSVSLGTLHRDPQSSSTTPGTVLDPPPPPNEQPAPPPRWFRQMGAKVRIVRNQFVACEVTAKIDIQTAAEDRLQAGMPSGNSGTLPQGQPLGANPADGLIDFRLVIQIDDATDTVSVIGYYGADPADVDGLFLWGTRPGQPPAADPGFGLNFFGTTIVFMPLISAGVGAVANDGALAELGMTAAMLAIPATLAGLAEVGSSPVKLLCERVTWFGGEVQFRVRPSGVEAVILFDMEAALSLDVSIGGKTLLKIDRSAPLAVRYKAVGIRIGDDPDQPKFQFRPIFDASKGYTIDVSKPGAITVASPLDQILTILGARIARNNPLIFEIDLGFAVDLGVVTIERARIRMRFDPVSAPELTAFAASVDIPGAVSGRGYLEMNEHEIKGQIDLTIVPVHMRVAAGVGIADINENGRKATGVIISLEIEFPVAIPLGTSGLGIYGFLGLFAMHYARKEPPPSSMAPALAWLKDIAHSNPIDIAAWTPKIDNWAFGVGAILGTMGSSVIFNMKGVLLLELPGPRLLLMMKAKLLAVLPELSGEAEGTFLAVIDLDMGRGTLTIGLAVEFSIKPLLEIHIPVEAFFNFNNTKDWHLFLGRYTDQIHAKILEVFEGSGYLMLSGKGFAAGDIESSLLIAPITGFAISAGLHVSFVWGSKSVGLYAEVAAGFDAVIGFDPFLLAGKLYLRGTLHIFIIDISAWADLTVAIGELPDGSKVSQISGDICGKVEFLFFDVEGCVHFQLGETAVPDAPPPQLFQSLRLVSRSPALAVGTGVDKSIDGGIAEGILSETAPAPPPPPPPPSAVGQPAPAFPMNQRRVPIDAIPLAMLAMPPITSTSKYIFRGVEVTQTPGTPGAPSDGWIQKGDDVFQYTLTSAELIGDLLDGATPAVWWPQKAGDSTSAAQLGLLSWVPDPTPKAIERSQFLDDTLTETWGTVCNVAAPPTSVLFTFLQEAFGPSLNGWRLDGEAWPDPPATIRSSPPVLRLIVTERWRTGIAQVDSLIGVIPAVVEGATVRCLPANRNPLGPQLRLNPVLAARGLKRPDVFAPEEFTLIDLAGRANSGLEISRSMLTRVVVQPTQAPAVNAEKACTSRVLAAPVLDSRDLRPFGDRNRLDEAGDARKKRGFRSGPFDDAVVFQTGAVETTTFYLFVHREILASKIVVVATTDANDTVFEQIVLDASFTMPSNTFPARWTDATGPWVDEVFRLAQHQAVVQPRGYIGVLVTIKGSAKADRIQIGLLRQKSDWHRKHMVRPFYVAAVEVFTQVEFQRSDYDTTEQTHKQNVLEASLADSSSGQALLKPDTAYAVKVSYDAQRGKRRPGESVKEIVSLPGKHETFWFFTDNEPPRRLDPWIMCSTPEDGEHHYFGHLPIHVVFNSPDIGRIYGAYGKRLQIRLRAASFRPLPNTPEVPHPFVLTAATLVPVIASVLSPWEAVMVDQLTKSCVPVSGNRFRHTTATVPIPLEPFTDYVLDIEMVDTAAPAETPGTVVWRTGFSTGRFATLAAFAESFQFNRVLHRFSKPGLLQAIAAQPWAGNPQGNQLDMAMITAGLEPMGVPEAPRVIVFWEAGVPNPQPAAVLVDSSEPMWRSRKIPRNITDPQPPNASRQEMTTVTWMQLEESGSAITTKVIQAPGGHGALITLAPNSRGQTLKLVLRRIAMKESYLDGPTAADELLTILDTKLARAPWEEED